MNLNALMTSKTFCYLTQTDFMQAFEQDQTILLAKDLQKIQFLIDEEPPAVVIKGSEIRPIKFLAVNNEIESIKRLSNDDIEKLNNDNYDEIYDDSTSHFSTKTKFKKTDEIVLFRRKVPSLLLVDHDKSELTQIASRVLTNNRFKGKSKFHFVNEHNLGVDDNDYSDPAFMQIDHPNDVDYNENYSIEAPSVHDLFDMDALPIDPLLTIQSETYDEDEEMLEEYIIEEIVDYEI